MDIWLLLVRARPSSRFNSVAVGRTYKNQEKVFGGRTHHERWQSDTVLSPDLTRSRRGRIHGRIDQDSGTGRVGIFTIGTSYSRQWSIVSSRRTSRWTSVETRSQTERRGHPVSTLQNFVRANQKTMGSSVMMIRRCKSQGSFSQREGKGAAQL